MHWKLLINIMVDIQISCLGLAKGPLGIQFVHGRTSYDVFFLFTPLPSSCLVTSIIVQLESGLNRLYSHTAALKAFMITFWVEDVHIWERIIYFSCN